MLINRKFWIAIQIIGKSNSCRICNVKICTSLIMIIMRSIESTNNNCQQQENSKCCHSTRSCMLGDDCQHADKNNNSIIYLCNNDRR